MPTLTEQARAVRDRVRAVPAGTLTLAQFAGSGRTEQVYSDVLGEEVLFAADNAHVPDTETRIVYQSRELALLLDATPEGLRLTHEVKKWFGGEIEAE